MLAYRLYLHKTISEDQWRVATKEFHSQWILQRERTREKAQGAGGGPDYYVVRRHHLGGALIGTTTRLLASGALTTVKASQILGVKPNSVRQLMAGVRSTSRRAS